MKLRCDCGSEIVIVGPLPASVTCSSCGAEYERVNSGGSRSHNPGQVAYALGGFVGGLFAGLLVYHGIMHTITERMKRLGLLKVPYS